MTDPAPTFSVEVLGFPPGADPDVLAESVSGFFGISKEEARRLVVKAPIRVKRNAPPDVTQKLVRQLRKLGADVLIRNDVTGEERTYRIEEAPVSRKPSASTPDGEAAREIVRPRVANPDAPPPDDTLQSESEDDPAPLDTAPVIEILAVSSPPVSTPRPTDPAISEKPDSPAADSDRRASSPEGLEGPRSGKPAGSRPAISLPPPSMPQGGAAQSVPPPSAPAAAKLDYCASCTRPVDKGETCSKCGWNNATKERVCRQCKGPLSIVSVVTHHAWLLAVIFLVSAGLAAGGFTLFGPLFAAAFLALGAAGAFAADGLTLRFTCKKCTVAVYSERLQKEETARLRTARGKALTAGVLCAGMMAAFAALTSYAGPVMTGSSYGLAWHVAMPRAHNDRGDTVAMLKTPAGSRRVRIQFAARPYVGGTTYYLAHVQYTYPSGPTDLDREGMDAVLKQIVEVVYNGTPAGAIEASGDSRELSFSGTFRGQQVFGRLRGTQYDHDMLFTAVTSDSEADVKRPDTGQFFASLAVEKDAKQ